ncbi:MAG: anti-sigma factor antagonist [Planctomycetes bacterium]|nr:anti-sigma factor antagonist [Planctomycetota bacterium]
MADLSITTRDVQGVENAALIIIGGAIDAKTVPGFQEQMDQLKDSGITRFILDMADIRYVNSTGLGYLVNLADNLEPQGGGIALVKVQPKVKIVFDMLGLNAFFKIYTNQKAAVDFFASGGAVETPPEAPVEAAPPPPAAPPPTAPKPPPRPIPVAPVAATTPAPMPKPATRPIAPPVPAPVASATSEELSETVDCSVCKSTLRVGEPGSYKCPRCSTVFSYLSRGKTNFLPRRKILPVALTLIGIPECTEGLCTLVALLSRRAGFAENTAQEIQTAVRDVALAIIGQGYGGNEQCTYQVLVTQTEGEVTVKFSDYGKILDTNGSTFGSARNAMDSFEVRPHPKSGNVITMTKRR